MSTVSKHESGRSGSQRRHEYGTCDLEDRHNLSALGVYEIPFHPFNILLNRLLSRWQYSESAILHSELPFSVLSASYLPNNSGIFQGIAPQYVCFLSLILPLRGCGWCHANGLSPMADLRYFPIRCRSQRQCLCRRRFTFQLSVWRIGAQSISQTTPDLFGGLSDGGSIHCGTGGFLLAVHDYISKPPASPSPFTRLSSKN